jgi:hypothetical protein
MGPRRKKPFGPDIDDIHEIHVPAAGWLSRTEAARGTMTDGLSPVFLDNHRVALHGNPRPPVSRILAAGGARDGQPVMWVRAPDEPLGRPVHADEVIDRTVKAEPVYLVSMNELPPGLASNLAPKGIAIPERESES